MSYPLGSVVPLAWYYGLATTAVVTVTLPDGTTATPAVTGTTLFSASYTPTLAGRHLVRWVGTGTNPGAAPVDVFEVDQAADPGLLSLKDLRDHLNWPTTKGTEDDAELLGFGASATDTCEGYLGRPLRRATRVERFDGGRGALLLRANPCPCIGCAPCRVITVTAVVENGVTLTNGATDYTLDPVAGLLYRGVIGAPGVAGGWPWLAITPASIVVTYVSGYTSTPEWARLAVKRQVEHLWTRSQQSRHTRGGGQPEESTPVATFLLPYAVQSILDPHRSAGF